MITKQQFNHIADAVRADYISALPKMIKYKSTIQKNILEIATRQELEDIKKCRINQGMIDKLAKLAHDEWAADGDTASLYCAAMAVATIIKEYDWGIQYLIGDGLYAMALRIYNA